MLLDVTDVKKLNFKQVYKHIKNSSLIFQINFITTVLIALEFCRKMLSLAF